MKDISLRNFQQKKVEILELLREETKPFEDISEEAQAERSEGCRQDKLEFGRVYLPHYFEQGYAPFHKELIEYCHFAEAGKAIIPTLYMVPRGFGKSTIVSFLDTIHDILYGLCNFTILGSDTSGLPESFIEAILFEIDYNERIRQDFLAKIERIESRTKDYLVINNCCVMAVGRRSQTRGWKFRNFRPQKFKLDDLENDVSVKNPKNAKGVINWIKKGCIPSLDPQKGALIWIGTNINKKSAIELCCKKEEGWRKEKKKALEQNENGDYISLWPERFSVEYLLQQRELLGTMDFGSEYQNEPLDENEKFKEEWFIKIPRDENWIPSKEKFRAAFCDPSVGDTAKSDYKAIIVVEYDYKDTFIVLYAWIRKATIAAMIDVMFDVQKRYILDVFGLETQVFQKLLVDMIRIKEKERGEVLPIREITQHINKAARIERLSPYAERGQIKLIENSGDVNLLIEQFIFGPEDDGPDATEGAIRLCQEYGMKWTQEDISNIRVATMPSATDGFRGF